MIVFIDCCTIEIDRIPVNSQVLYWSLDPVYFQELWSSAKFDLKVEIFENEIHSS